MISILKKLKLYFGACPECYQFGKYKVEVGEPEISERYDTDDRGWGCYNYLKTAVQTVEVRCKNCNKTLYETTKELWRSSTP